MTTKSTLFLLVLGAFLALLGCQGPTGPRAFSGNYPIKAVCTTGMVADLVRNVGGSQVEVDQIMGADVDPHLYKASPGDLSKLAAADIVFYSGLHLEGKMTHTLETLGKKNPAIPVGEKIDLAKILMSGEVPDPHAWFDVSLWSQAGEAVRDALVAYDPAHAEDYKNRSKIFQAELAKLHEYAREQIATIPRAQRALITSHDAFRYFGRAYDIEVHGIQGISTEAEASVKDINDRVRMLSRRKIKAVFVESSVNQRNMQALIEGCKSAGHEIALGGELYSDAMGHAGTPEGTYIGMVRHNVDTIVKALK